MTSHTSPGDSAPPARGKARTLLGFDGAGWRLVGFGLSLVFFASFGQTFYIGLFGTEIRAAFGLSHAAFGAIYTLATLASAMAIAWTGALFDRTDLRVYATGVCVTFIAAHFVMGFAETVVALGVGIFLLRQAGQGLMLHTAQATMARTFERRRGRALSFAALGIPAGEAVFPAVAVGLIAWAGWPAAWLWSGAALALFLVPLSLWLLRGQGARQRDHLAARETAQATGGRHGWTRAQVLRDVNFYLVLSPFLLITFLITGLFFHQGFIAAAKGWELTLVVQGFVGYSVVRAAMTLAMGHWVDRLGAVRLVAWFMAPMGLALLVLAVGAGAWSVYLYFVLAAFSTGGAQTLLGAIWAEIYGAEHIGAIRSAVVSIWVASGAAATWAMGQVFDAGVSVSAAALTGVGLVVAASIAAGIGAARCRRRP